MTSIVRTPGIVGGKARIEGTRWPVWIAYARCLRGGETALQVQLDYPWLSIEQITAAVEWAREHPDEAHDDWRRAQGDDETI